MVPTRKRFVVSAVVAMLALTLSPVASFARPKGAPTPTRRSPSRAVGVADVGASWVPSVAPDAKDPSDDTTRSGVNYTNKVWYTDPAYGWGNPAYEESRTICWASNDSTLTEMDAKGDQDWFRFAVSPEDTLIGKPYLIEAKATNPFVDTVIEVYGPVDASHAITPSDPRDIWTAGGATDLDIGNPTCVAANDNGSWFGLGYSSSVWFMPDVTTTQVDYYVRVRPVFDALEAGGETIARGYLDAAGPYRVRLKAGTFTRLAGGSRIQTAVKLSQERYAEGELPLVSFDGTGSVIIANAYNYPDALAGSSLAGAVNGPILLTGPTALAPEVAAEITRLGAQRAFILGSTMAVSQDVEDSLRALVPAVERVAGTTRVTTGIEIAKATARESHMTTCAFVANGWSFPDALSASPMSAYNVAPIFLIHGWGLDTYVASAMHDLGVTDVIILGSEAAVSKGAADQLIANLGASHVGRIGGGDRYETSRNIAGWSTGYGTMDFVGTTADPQAMYTLDHRAMAVASGSNFPDALGGGAFAGLSTAGYPLLLTPGNGWTGSQVPSKWIFDINSELPAGKKSYLESLPGGSGAVKRSYIIGGPLAVTDSTFLTLDLLVGLDTGSGAPVAASARLTPQERLATIRGRVSAR